MKKYTLYFLSLILIISCSKEETNSEEQENETFLQRVNGMGFVNTGNYDGEQYIYFTNSEQFLRYFEIEGDVEYTICQIWSERSETVDNERIEIKILSNTYQSLILELIWEYQSSSGSSTHEFKVNETESILTYSFNDGEEKTTTEYRITGKKSSDFDCDETELGSFL